MFQLYTQNIDPNNPDFQTFIKRYVVTRDTRKPEVIPYSELYRIVREGIREYLHKSKKTERKPRQ